MSKVSCLEEGEIKMCSLKALSVGLFVIVIVQVVRSEDYTLNTTSFGEITGVVKTVSDALTVTQFLGIPYAEPPVGDLRFKKPVPKVLPFQSPFDARQFGPACIQNNTNNPSENSEDCLFLNVYVPYNMSTSGIQGNRRPVMIWIHGGSFITGGSHEYDGSLLGTYGDVIVVTINYRLGILGWLTTGDDLLPGNRGLWDQQMAIQWVHANIEAFGGDAGKVTIFGLSAGSASVMYQCFHPGNSGLFHRAIAQSGSLTTLWANRDKQFASRNVAYFGDIFGCNQSNNADIIECLKQVPAEQISATSLASAPAFLSPVTDGYFVLDTPDNFMYGRSTVTNAYDMFYSVDLIIGYTSADGLNDINGIMALLGITNPDEFKIPKAVYEGIFIPAYLGIYANRLSVSKAFQIATINEYTDWSDPYSDDKRNKKFTDFITDPLYVAPTALTADLHSNNTNSSTYVYEFAVRPYRHFTPLPAPLDGSEVTNHADDVSFVFGYFLDEILADEEYSYLLQTYWNTMTLWTNFAKSGNPNIPRNVSDMINTVWPDYSQGESYIRFTNDMSPESVKMKPRQRTSNYWNNIVPSLVDLPSQDISRDDTAVTVTTTVGDIMGIESYVPWSNAYGFRVAAYRGIPYAKAPVGNLRFQKPVPKESFNTPFNASEYGPACYQLVMPMFSLPTSTPKSEDCLLLNVFVPSNMGPGESEKAVMIWIHGGAYITGESNLYDPRVLAGYGDVIVVTMNYRLGYFGFMTTGDNVIPSNLALWDQHTAIKWVHDNIGAFGGDTNRVTVFGESAGAGCVGYQMFYPGNSGLFQRAIGQSGTMGNPGEYINIETSLQYTSNFATQVNCSMTKSTNFLECLQSKPIEDLQNAINSIGISRIPYPTRDNMFVLDTPQNILAGASTVQEALDMFKSIDYMTGFTNGDGLIMADQWSFLLGQFNPDRFSLTRSGFQDILVPLLLNMTVRQDSQGQNKRSMLHEYTDWSDPDLEHKRALKLVDMFTDAMFAVPAIRATDLHAMSNHSTYLYEFSVRPLTRSYQIPALFDGPNVMNHNDDTQYVMGAGITAVSDSEEHNQQFRVHQATMVMWSNFAKSGNPNTPNDVTKFIYTTWPQYDSSRQYLEITQEVTQNAAKQRPHLQALNFWSSLLPETSSISERLDTCSRETSAANHLGLGLVILLPLTICLIMLNV